ncbi:MAG: peroxiredoxin [Oleiphilaceae bacterium]|nr:peroxiredoxin [Oleiphilaceae bacterium]
MIQVGDKLPEHTFQLLNDDGMQNPTSSELFSGKKVVLFAVPGAFTPTCSAAHLPSYVVHADELKGKGVDAIICTSVNDAFVMKAWGDSSNAENLLMLADGDGEFAKAIGLGVETGAFGGIRSQRYSMIVEDGVVTALNVDQPMQYEVSGAEVILEQL